MDMTDTCSSGSHPQSNRPNWQPGDDDADELLTQKIADALRDGKSERQIAKLLGISRMMLWRGKVMSAIPDVLADRLMVPRTGGKALLHVAWTLSKPDNYANAATHCSPTTR